MLGKLVLEQHGVTSLANNRTSRLGESGGTRRLLPGDHTPAIDEGGERMSVVAKALTVNSSSLLAVFVDCACDPSGFSFVPIECLVEQKIELDRRTKFPVVLFCGKGFEPDADFLGSALGQEYSRSNVGSYLPR